MRIEIWSDVVCPWCYIGKRRLERALADFAHRDQVELVWRSFQLDPGAPLEPVESVAEHLGRKYGGGLAGGQRMIDQVEAVAAEEGLVFRLGRAQRVGTGDAHRLLHLAAQHGLQGDLKEALLHAYFADARNVADHEVLLEIATGVGLDEATVRETLAARELAEEVESDIRQAQAYGANGVPFFVVDQRYGVSGAQPVEVFTEVLRQAWDDSHPRLDVVGGPGSSCGPGGSGCA